ncbi:MAG: ribbon-helix-helix domain-containing protein [Thermoanaerobaculaceae bacterium]|jgi:predicted DNA-binding protein
MAVQTVRLPEAIARRLEKLAKSTKRSKSSFIVEALQTYLDERDDLETALARVREPQAKYVDHDEVKRALGID